MNKLNSCFVVASETGDINCVLVHMSGLVTTNMHDTFYRTLENYFWVVGRVRDSILYCLFVEMLLFLSRRRRRPLKVV